ncbi:transposase [Alloacidobacterium dinghuense]|uniref:Transposase n=1 Tax=Alloacidobacterium dinghuense TaxID=2763107 RepID=A0A7G8BN55_9BACT|nr:transposase [Alloacidobacterium dinghuense]QNI33975.1 transposase [Alloacidobacterium dinghuense]
MAPFCFCVIAAVATFTLWKWTYLRLPKANSRALIIVFIESSSIDLELWRRILLIGYLYGISSERKVVEELRKNLVCRWFTGLDFDEEVHTTPRFRIAMEASRIESARSRSRKLWLDAWQLNWCAGASCQ